MTESKDIVILKLSNDQALVLFEWLTKQDERGTFTFDHKSERQVMWAIQGQLEKSLTEPFADDYLTKLAEARAKIISE